MEFKSLSDFLPYCKENLPQMKLGVIKGEDSHTLEAVVKAQNEGVIKAIITGDENKIRETLKILNADPDDYIIKNTSSDEEAIQLAIDLVHAGEVDFLMKGLIETKDLMKKMVARESGMRLPGKIMSKVDFNELKGYHKLYMLSDSALNPKPDLAGKKKIIDNALEVLHSVGIKKPKVAVLAASETLNPKLQESVDAYELKQMYERGEFSECYLEGPISIDLAIDPESVKIKNYPSPVGGDADLLICPDLVSGNMMGKGMLLAGTKAAGIIVGAKVPIVLMSRSAAVIEKFNSILFGAMAAKKGE
jgi:phosphate butyryltransferase